MIMQKLFSGLALLLLMNCQTKLKASDEVVLMAYFDDDQDGLKLAYSQDGFKWRRLNEGEAIFNPKVGHGLFRDPYLTRSPEGTFIMVWTTGWSNSDIGFAVSPTLNGWTKAWTIPLMKSFKETQNSWAPELYYLEKTKEYFVFWASTVGKKKYDHRIY